MKFSSALAIRVIRVLSIISLLGLASALYVRGQVTFFTPPTFIGQAPIFVADFNGDGKADILGSTSPGFIVNLGNGNGTFTAGTTGLDNVHAVADFNGDGKPDVLELGSVTLRVQLGNGDGTFGPPIGTNSNAALITVAAADLNGDGYADVVGIFNSSLMVYLSKGDGTFLPGVPYSLGSSSASLITFGDFNGDGKTDVAVFSTGSAQEIVFLGNGDGTLQAPKTSACISGPNSVVAGDFNGDGKLDLVVSGSPICCNPGNVTIQLGNGDGTFQSPMNIVPGGTLAAADLNGDGKLDLVVDNTIELGNGDGTFTFKAGYFSGRPYAIADFNQDGKLDIAMNGGILLGRGDGTFEDNPAVTTPCYRPPLLPAVADFDQNGTTDVAVACPTDQQGDTNAVFILSNDGTGQLSVVHSYPLSQSQTVSAATTADVNGDGHLDLVVVGTTYPNGTDWLISVLLGHGDGSFDPPIVSSIGNKMSGPQLLVTADFNNDHKLDLAMPFSDNSTVLIMPGNGDGTFGPPAEFFDDGAVSFVSADFNRDGNLDIAAAGNNGMAILLGKGDGTFQQATFASNSKVSSVAVGDLNGDGKPDLIGGNGIYLGNGDGTFTVLSSSAVGTPVDIDGDGKVDVFGSQFIPLSLVELGFYLGNGDGTFGPFIDELNYDVTGQVWPIFAIAVDMNGDGKPDIVGNLGVSTDVFVLLNTTAPVPGATFSPTSVIFSSQTVGTSSGPVPVRLTNTGKVTLMVTGVSMGGANASDFSQTNNCSTVQPGASCMINVSFTPTAGGAAAADVIVADNARGGSQKVALTGTGMEPCSIGPTNGSQTSATVSAGNSAKFSLAVSSTSWSGTVNLSCSITPMVTPAPMCTVPGSVTVTAGTDAPVSVTVATTAPGPVGMTSSVNFPPGTTLVMWTLVLLASGLSFVSHRRLPSLAAPAIVLVFLAMAGCGGGGSSSHATPGTPAGTYTATVKATSGVASVGTTLTVIVQ